MQTFAAFQQHNFHICMQAEYKRKACVYVSDALQNDILSHFPTAVRVRGSDTLSVRVCVCASIRRQLHVFVWMRDSQLSGPSIRASLPACPLCHTTRPAEGKRQQLLDNRTFYLNFTHPYLRKIKNQHSGPRLMKILEKRIKAFYHKHLFNM